MVKDFPIVFKFLNWTLSTEDEETAREPLMEVKLLAEKELMDWKTTELAEVNWSRTTSTLSELKAMLRVSVTDCKPESMDSMSLLLLTSKTFNSKTLIPSKEVREVSEMTTCSAEVIPEVKPVAVKAGKALNSRVPTVVNWARLTLARMVFLDKVKAPEINCKVGARKV